MVRNGEIKRRIRLGYQQRHGYRFETHHLNKITGNEKQSQAMKKIFALPLGPYYILDIKKNVPIIYLNVCFLAEIAHP